MPERVEADDEARAICMIGEIGGSQEAEAAVTIAAHPALIGDTIAQGMKARVA